MYCQLIGRVSLGFQLVCGSLKVNETIKYAWMLQKRATEKGVIANAFRLTFWPGLFLSDSVYQSQVCGWCGHVCVGMHVGDHPNENNYISPSGPH